MRKLRHTGNRFIVLREVATNASLWKELVGRLPADREIFENSVLFLEFDPDQKVAYMSFPPWVFSYASQSTINEFPYILADLLGTDRLIILLGEPYPYWQVASETPCPRCGSTDTLWQELPKGFTKCHSYRAVCQECDRWRGWIGKRQIDALRGLGIKPIHSCWVYAPRLHSEDKGWAIIHHPSDFGRSRLQVDPPGN